ncbi:hypothetical protein FS837_008040 [Tulasnella sp. UAMH 9824]|nr:hypothetical protein FS837_008040 [Tulasnella sp. UAMH 9824]
MASRVELNMDRSKNRQRSAAPSVPLPPQHRPSAGKHAHETQNFNELMPTCSGSGNRVDEGEEPDHARCPSDVSMEDDDNEESPSKHPRTAETEHNNRYAHGDTNLGGQFMRKVERVIERATKYIKWDDEDPRAISIPNNRKFVEKALPEHFSGIKGTEGSLWVRKDVPPSKDAPKQHTVQERHPTISTPGAAKVAPGPTEQPDMGARINELQSKLGTTTSELEKTQVLLLEMGRELKTTTTTLQQVLTMLKALSTGNGPSHSLANPGSEGLLAHNFLQMDGANGYVSVPNGSPPKAQADAYGVGNLREVPLGLEIAPSYNTGPAFFAGQPTHSQSSGYQSEANPSISQTYPGGHATLKGPFPQSFWMQQSNSVTMAQAVRTTSGHHPTSRPATGVPPFSDYYPSVPIQEVTFAHQASNSTQLSNPFGASGRAKALTGSFTVPSPANPNISNNLQQAHFSH